MIFMRFLLIIILSIAVSNCGAFKADKDPITGKKLRKEADLMKRGEDFAKEQGGIFNSKKLKRAWNNLRFCNIKYYLESNT